ncbi:SAM-dependent methyltransferase [Patescibacteria group bacterium]|nr:SAM-dependent methyltransferase [Patescibacteria group bacterium]MBU1705131.1 SAM-dependent methyltransferase [Patescibacteria group bacterium]
MFGNILLLIGFILLFSFGYAAISGAPWVPTWRHDTARALKLLDLQPEEKFYELGSGIGTLCVAAGHNPQVQVIGVELSLGQWLISQIRKMIGRTYNIQYRLGNLFQTNLSDADAVYFFLMPEVYEKLRPKLEKELRPGAKVVSYVWPVPGWEPVKVDKSERFPNLYFYIMR